MGLPDVLDVEGIQLEEVDQEGEICGFYLKGNGEDGTVGPTGHRGAGDTPTSSSR